MLTLNDVDFEQFEQLPRVALHATNVYEFF